MNLTFNTVINGYSFLLLTVIYFHSRKNSGNDIIMGRLFRYMVLFTMLLLGLDVFARFDGHTETLLFPIVNRTANLLLFLLNPVIPSIWVAYVHYQVYSDEARTKRLFYYLIALSLINAMIVVASLYTGWIYTIDAANIYHRGPYFYLSGLPTVLLIILSGATLIANRKRIEKRFFFSLLFFVFPPTVGTILQFMIYGYSLVINSIVISLLIIHLNIQNQSLNTDYLTEISNRKKFEALLNEKVKSSTSTKTFSLIMLDFDNFKVINDTLGHETGDDALRTSAQLLKSCIRVNDFVARIGGDEFCFILDISDKNRLNNAVERIKSRIESYNSQENRPYSLCFSMGYAVYDYDSHMKAESFLKHVDALMYKDKRERKKRNTPGYDGA